LKKFQDFFQMPGGKRKRNDLPPPYDAGGYIPQQDGAGDVVSGDFEIEVWYLSPNWSASTFYNNLNYTT
jgi:hypothetical protein